jgi:hypothetical protein
MNYILKISPLLILSYMSCATGMDSDATGMDSESTTPIIQNCIYEVKPKKHDSGTPCYLMGTQHVNGTVTNSVVKFISENCSQAYFEKVYSDDFSRVMAPYFCDVLLESHRNMVNQAQFPLPPINNPLINSINLIKEQFDIILRYQVEEETDLQAICQSYCEVSKNKVLKQHKKQNYLRKVSRESGNDEFILCVSHDMRVEELNKSRAEAYSKLSDHDKDIVDKLRNMDYDSLVTQAIDQEKTEEYIKAKQYNEQQGNLIAQLKEEMSSEDLSSAEAWLYEAEEKDRKKKEYLDTLASYVNPIDIITLALYAEATQFLDNAYKLVHAEKTSEGVEGSLMSAIESQNSDFIFSELESDNSRLMGMRKAIARRFLEMRAGNPYEPWESGFESLNSSEDILDDISAIFDKKIIEPKILSPILFGVLKESLTVQRENHWLTVIKDSMTPSSRNKSVLFAVGNEHIADLLDQLGKQGYEINKRILD